MSYTFQKERECNMMMEKSKPYFQPTADLIEASALDILRTSGGSEDNGGGNGGDLTPPDEL